MSPVSWIAEPRPWSTSTPESLSCPRVAGAFTSGKELHFATCRISAEAVCLRRVVLRLESTNRVETEWNNLRQTRLLPRLSDGKVQQRSIRRVGDLETILYEGNSSTLWIASGPWI